MTDRIKPMTWTRERDGRYIYHSAITRHLGLGRSIQWTVYRVGKDDWRTGVGIVGELGLHTVIGRPLNLYCGKLDVRDLAHRLGHEW